MNLQTKNPRAGRQEGGKAGNQNFTKNITKKIEFNENRPPCNLEAETGLIENLIFRPEKVALAASIVRASDYYSQLRGNVFQRIVEFYEAERVWNLTVLRDSFQGDPSSSKYRDFFDDLKPWMGELVLHNARLIKDCSDARKLIAATGTANLDLFNGTGVAEVSATLRHVLSEVG